MHHQDSFRKVTLSYIVGIADETAGVNSGWVDCDSSLLTINL
jgi:hypothetical protein